MSHKKDTRLISGRSWSTAILIRYAKTTFYSRLDRTYGPCSKHFSLRAEKRVGNQTNQYWNRTDHNWVALDLNSEALLAIDSVSTNPGQDGLSYSNVRYRGSTFRPFVRSFSRSSVRPSVHNSCQGAYSIAVIAGSMKPCIVITLDTLFKQAPWPSALDLDFTLHWLCQNFASSLENLRQV